MSLTLQDLKNGDVVIVNSCFGAGPLVVGTIVNMEENIKNGFPGIDYTTSNGAEKWAYLSQVVRKADGLEFVSTIEPQMYGENI